MQKKTHFTFLKYIPICKYIIFYNNFPYIYRYWETIKFTLVYQRKFCLKENYLNGISEKTF